MGILVHVQLLEEQDWNAPHSCDLLNSIKAMIKNETQFYVQKGGSAGGMDGAAVKPRKGEAVAPGAGAVVKRKAPSSVRDRLMKKLRIR